MKSARLHVDADQLKERADLGRDLGPEGPIGACAQHDTKMDAGLSVVAQDPLNLARQKMGFDALLLAQIRPTQEPNDEALGPLVVQLSLGGTCLRKVLGGRYRTQQQGQGGAGGQHGGEAYSNSPAPAW